MSVYKFLLVPLFAALPLASYAADDLAPPDVDLFLELQYGKADLDKLGMDTTGNGYRVRAGLWLNSLATPRLQFALEAGLTQLARENETDRFNRLPTADEQLGRPPLSSVDVAARNRLQVSGYEFGGRVLLQNRLYARAGLFLHQVKTRHEETRTLNYLSGSTETPPPSVPDTASRNKTGAYAGLGLLLPLTSSISIAADYSLYMVDGEQVGSYAAGLHLRF